MNKKAILLILLAFTFACSKNDDGNDPSINPVYQLPPATQIGANKAGCLLDGEVFLPDNRQNSTNCFYQIVDGKSYFYMNFNNFSDDVFKSISLGTESLQIQQNQDYNLINRIEGNAYGLYIENISDNYTSNIHTGKLTITKLTDQIVSGTFWFDVEDQNGVVHQIREGRFDMKYTN